MPSTPIGQDLGDFIRVFQADRSSINESANIAWSEEWFDRQSELYEDWWSKLHAIPFETLDDQGKIDWILFRNFIEVSRARITLERKRLNEMDRLLPFFRADPVARTVSSQDDPARWRASRGIGEHDRRRDQGAEAWDEYKSTRHGGGGTPQTPAPLLARCREALPMP